MSPLFRPRSPAGRRRAVTALVLLAVTLVLAATAPAAADAWSRDPDGGADIGKKDYRWGNVAIGGGGYVTGMVVHPAERDLVYIRTDVGGAYRWNPSGEEWVPITDWIGPEDRDLYRIESLAIAPTDPDVVYLAGGNGVPEQSSIMKSADRGATWTISRLGIAISGNAGGRDNPSRSSGERLAVDPGTTDIVYFGSRYDGLWRSTDSGATWARVATLPSAGAPGRGVSFVVFARGNEPAGAATRTIYLSVYGEGIYRSADAGASWSLLPGSPAKPNRAALASTGDLYVTHKTGIARFSGGDWTDVTPATDLFARDANTTGVRHAWRAVDGGYEVELAIPWANLGVTPAADQLIGFDIGNNDDDDGGGREGQAVAFGTANNWTDTSAFGDLTLLATGGTPPAEGISADRVTGDKITVDGSLTEAAWNHDGADLPYRLEKVVSGTWNNTAVYSTLWSGDHLYVGARVSDAALHNDNSNVWDDDSVEVYIDGDHNHGTSYDANDNQYIKGWNRAAPEHNAVSVDPTDPRHLVAATAVAGFNNPIVRSTDGGETWAKVPYVRNNTVPWWPDYYWSASTATLTIDPFHPDRVWYTDWYGSWRTDDITEDPSTWTNYERGHEEAVVVSNIASPPAGEVLLHSGVADNGGYDHTSLTEFPTASHRARGLPDTTTTGLDFAEADPNFLVRVGRQGNTGAVARGGYSTDGGKTYTPFASLPEAAGRVAVSADGKRIVWAAQGDGDGAVHWSDDRGATWRLSEGAPTGSIPTNANWVGCQPLASDRVDGDTFYMYKAGRFYRSADGGATFTKLSNVDRARAFGFGIGKGKRSPSPKAPPAVYLHGDVGGVAGIWRSDDLGKHWTKINTTQAIGCRIKDMTGDRQVYGRAYIATDGRGIYVGSPTRPARPSRAGPR